MTEDGNGKVAQALVKQFMELHGEQCALVQDQIKSVREEFNVRMTKSELDREKLHEAVSKITLDVKGLTVKLSVIMGFIVLVIRPLLGYVTRALFGVDMEGK